MIVDLSSRALLLYASSLNLLPARPFMKEKRSCQRMVVMIVNLSSRALLLYASFLNLLPAQPFMKEKRSRRRMVVMIVDLSSRVLLFVHVALKSTSSPTIYERKTVVPKNGAEEWSS